MPEDRPPISPDVRDVPFGVVVEEAIELLADNLGKYPPAFDAIVAPAIQRVTQNDPYPEMVYFDEGGRSYGYSASFRDTDEAYIPEDAITLVEGANRLFFQISHSGADSGRVKGEAELIIGDVTYTGRAAVEHAHEAFPRFFPPPELQAEALREIRRSRSSRLKKMKDKAA
jgi:hypothetical protein